MAPSITYRGTVWPLRRDGVTARAEIVEFEGVGLELRYTRNDKPFVQRLYTDGAELLREATIERFELERKGWTADLWRYGESACGGRVFAYLTVRPPERPQ